MLEDLVQKLQDPKSQTPLSLADDRRSLSSDRMSFPIIDDIPWLFADPKGVLWEWRTRIGGLVQHLDREIDDLAATLNKGSLASESTQTRLRNLHEAKVNFRNQIITYLLPVAEASQGAGNTGFSASLLPHTQRLLSYEDNLFRDWCWGDPENTASVGCIKEVLPQDFSTGDMLVLGAGGCRLAYDLHQELAAKLTVALDLNPLLLYLGKKVITGEVVELSEIPYAATQLDSLASPQALHCKNPLAKDANFTWIMADGLNPPFRERSFQTVVTPWFVDIVGQDFLVVVRTVNRLLPEGGTWINFGSLMFKNRPIEQQYSLQEVKEIAAAEGFEVRQVHRQRIPYLACPTSDHHRQEMTTTLLFKKVGEAREVPANQRSETPPWLDDIDKAVPRSAMIRDFVTRHNTYAELAKLITGSKSIRELSKQVARTHNMGEEDAVLTWKQLLNSIWNDHRLNIG